MLSEARRKSRATAASACAHAARRPHDPHARQRAEELLRDDRVQGLRDQMVRVLTTPPGITTEQRSSLAALLFGAEQ